MIMFRWMRRSEHEELLETERSGRRAVQVMNKQLADELQEKEDTIRRLQGRLDEADDFEIAAEQMGEILDARKKKWRKQLSVHRANLKGLVDAVNEVRNKELDAFLDALSWGGA